MSICRTQSRTETRETLIDRDRAARARRLPAQSTGPGVAPGDAALASQTVALAAGALIALAAGGLHRITDDRAEAHADVGSQHTITSNVTDRGRAAIGPPGPQRAELTSRE